MTAPLTASMLGTFGGMPIKIIEDGHMLDRHEDWSGVRSPSRAERRRKRGFPQRIKVTFTPKQEIYQIGDRYVMHPAMATVLRNKLREFRP